MTIPMRRHVICNNDIHQHKETSHLSTSVWQYLMRWRCLCRPSKTLASGPAPTWVLDRSPS